MTAEIGRRIRKRRDELGLSQWDAALKAEITGTHWGRLEDGKQGGTKWATMCAIAQVLQTTPEELLGLDAPPEGDISAELQQEVSKLDAGRQRKLLQLIRALQQYSIVRSAA